LFGVPADAKENEVFAPVFFFPIDCVFLFLQFIKHVGIHLPAGILALAENNFCPGAV